MSRTLARVALYAFLVALSVPLVFPFLWMISSALKLPGDVLASPPQLIPRAITWDNIRAVFTFQPFGRQIYNSLYIATLVALFTCALSLLSGYAFARLRFPGRNVIFFVFLSALMLPVEVTLIPNFTLMKHLGLADTHVPLLTLPVFGATGVTGIFLMRQFIQSVPVELEEAAMIDGMGRPRILLHVVLPLARPMLGTIGIIAFLYSWNSFLEPLVFVNRSELFTVPLALTAFTDTSGNPIWGVQMAATAISTVPLLIAYLVARRQITESLAQTGIK
ncbi:multiple sugar transport system permease protein [Amycolatopsis arida]|uniref:Multiple sugar transport system permease protein n=1 Tax=Amycolatopsis arida TaxID=587909 RepID=A0A1I5MFQ3_9PSEU|nr:carbohydrate ABC transporter permease [Amycolatopsis arida]TDX94071.1 multiple sugar transport system permease protein [Amycolatopsis arida]SFP08127.1 multiple sugar transport system permease protein [Amycolatopsis arida]